MPAKTLPCTSSAADKPDVLPEQLPTRRQILAKLEQEKAELANLKKDPLQLDPDEDSRLRLQAIRGGPTSAPSKDAVAAAKPYRSSQVCWELPTSPLFPAQLLFLSPG